MVHTPAAEHNISEALVRELLASQHADLSDLPIALLDNGWDNAMYRLGDEYVVRLPRRSSAAVLLTNEQRWLPELSKRLPIAIPAPLWLGRPDQNYPWHWSVIPWFAGKTADLDWPDVTQAEPMAEFLLALHHDLVVPQDSPRNAVRGVPLLDRAAAVEERLVRLRSVSTLITSSIEQIWTKALDATVAAQNCWLHGDLHARNLLVDAGRIVAVIDWGDITVGDAATDLACCWMLFDQAQARTRFLASYNPDAELLARAKGWALLFAAMLLDTGLIDHPRHAEMGRRTFARLAEDELTN